MTHHRPHRIQEEMEKVTRILDMEQEYEKNIFSQMPVLSNLSLSTASTCSVNSSHTCLGPAEGHQCCSSLRSTFGSLSDLRKYHEAHKDKNKGYEMNLNKLLKNNNLNINKNNDKNNYPSLENG